MDRVCHLCGRDYGGDIFWTSSLRRHLARKNACNRVVGSVFVRDRGVVVADHCTNALSDVVCGVFEFPKGLVYYDVVPWLFRRVFSDELNVCFMRPNKSKNEILVKVSSQGLVRQVTVDAFIKLFVNHVFLKKMFPLIENNVLFVNWLASNMITGCYWNGIFPDGGIHTNGFGARVKNRPDFMIHMRLAVKEFINTHANKKRVQNILLNW